MTPRLALTGITKHYGDVAANDDVTLAVRPGEILAVLGENGAGKSTLMKVVYGVARPDAGTIAVDGIEVEIASPAQARGLGVAMVFQHFALFDTLTVAENIALGAPEHPLSGIGARVQELSQRYGLELHPDRRVHDLSVGERQRVEILRALMSNPRILILDEPTSVLTPQAVDRLFDTLRQLARDGVSIVFISHKLDEIRRLATRCAVMRGGRLVATVDPRAESEAGLARLMLGADPPAIATHDSPPGDVALDVLGLTVRGAERRHWLHDLTFSVRCGEILGIAGVSGNGQAALMSSLAGEWPTRPDVVRLFGQPVGNLGPAQRRARGLRYIPEQRLGHGAVPELSLLDNVVLTGDSLHRRGVVQRDEAHRYADGVIRAFDVHAEGVEARAASLSGGNLQRFIVGRETLSEPRVLVVDQPTWGVDVGAAVAIRNALIALRSRGCAIVVISEEIDELYQLCDRLMVIAKGRLSPIVGAHDISVDELGRWMAGLWPAGEALPA
ncbi:MAG: ABC transporter ATP-binding protein [Burkholderiaceae bacterium]